MKDQIEKAIDLVLEQDRDEFLEQLKAQKRIGNYTVRPDGIVDVNGNVDISDMNLTKIPVKFGIVTGYFSCYNNQLTTLQGAPEEVGEWYGGSFDCSNNKLTSLEGCPKEVKGDFDCSYNHLISLEGCPKEVKGDFNCFHNQLTSLEGAPEEVDGSFACTHNLLTSLIGCPEEVGYVYCDNNPVEFTEEDIELAKQGKAPLGLPLSFVLMKNKKKEFKKQK